MFPWTSRARRFEQSALPHLPAVYRLACQLVGQEAAEDIAQETFLRAWKYFDRFEAGTNCRAWLFRILRNLWISRWRRSHLELPLAELDGQQIEPYYDWEDEFLRGEMSAHIEQALAALPAEFRWTVLLADVEGFSYQEIADIVECPIGTVMSRLNRGRRMLRRLLRALMQDQSSTEDRGAFPNRSRRSS